MKRSTWILLCLPTLGFTECEYFSPVTVPAVDTEPPELYFRMWLNGVESIHAFDDPIRVNPDDWFDVYPAAIDQGGVRTLLIEEQVMVACDDPVLGGPSFYVRYYGPEYEDQQDDLGGRRVSNGLYGAGVQHNIGQYLDDCPPGRVATYAVYYLGTTATDFHGNSAPYFSTSIRLYWNPVGPYPI